MISESIERIAAYLPCLEIDPSLECVFEYIWYLIYLLLGKSLKIPNSCGLELIRDLLWIFTHLLSKCKY